MSRMATNEYIGAKRRAYALAGRAIPSGTTGLPREGRDNTATNQHKTIAEERKLSVQYLANQNRQIIYKVSFLFDKLGIIIKRVPKVK